VTARTLAMDETAIFEGRVENEEKSLPRALPKDVVEPRRRGVVRGFVTGMSMVESALYGVAAAAIVGYLLWRGVVGLWEQSSLGMRTTLVVLIGLAVAQLGNDVRTRRFSLLSGLLVGAWILVSLMLALAEIVT